MELVQPRKRYLVTRVETVTVEARNEDQAIYLGEQKLDFVGAETTDIEAEEAIDLDGMGEFLGGLED
jgi:hypothetical protein